MVEKDMDEIFLQPGDSLGEELFLKISRLVPIPNVDLLVQDDGGRILLSWRDDRFYGKGWHFPGGCIRFCETMQERVQRTALEELGAYVTLLEPGPAAVGNAVMGEEERRRNNNYRAHNITLMFRCRLPDGFTVDSGGRREGEPGYLKWFDVLPENLLKIHDKAYGDFLKQYRCAGSVL